MVNLKRLLEKFISMKTYKLQNDGLKEESAKRINGTNTMYRTNGTRIHASRSLSVVLAQALCVRT